jgi:hypothetical protein
MKRILLACLLLSAFVFADSQRSTWDIWLDNEGYYLLSPEQKEKFRALPDEQKQSYVDNGIRKAFCRCEEAICNSFRPGKDLSAARRPQLHRKSFQFR